MNLVDVLARVLTTAGTLQIILVLCRLLNKRPKVVVHNATLIFVPDKTHRVWELNNVVLKLYELFRFLHIYEMLL